jgi:shikimate dehydrogenase
MRPSGSARVAGVAGWPVGHSLSPRLMASWIEAAGIDALYAPFAIAPDDARHTLEALASTSLCGLNITLPHKEAALKIADEASEAAKAIGAANLLTFHDGRISADNTDAAGFMQALADKALPLDDRPVVILGAGGAARAIVYALSQAGVSEIRIANRTRSRALDISDGLEIEATIVDWDQRNSVLDDAQLVVNATSLGLKSANDLHIGWDRAPANCVAADIVYTPLQTGFLAQAAQRELVCVDGLGMLIGQARPSFEAFYGIQPPNTGQERALLEALLEPVS